jgi:uncharacterized protein
MPFLIDGHNLIPKIAGLSLQDPDDEIQLIELLQEFCRLSRKQAEVYFDGAPLGRQSNRSHGSVKAHFVSQGQTADAAIYKRLGRLGKGARNWTVISSDQAVQNAARSAHASILSSEAFTHLLQETLVGKYPEATKKPDISLDQNEIDLWLNIFKQNRK